MSWIGIKKAVNRAGTQLMVKTGQLEQTIDKEFEYEEKRFKTMETNLIQLQKRLRTYLDSLKLLTTSQVNIAELLNSFYGNEANTNTMKPSIDESHHFPPPPNSLPSHHHHHYLNLASEYYQTLKLLNDECVNELERPYNRTVLNPIARFNSYYVEVNEAIKKRNNKLLDYDAMRNKVKKLVDAQHTDHDDFENKLRESNEELKDLEDKFVEINNQLKDEIPKLVNMRVAFFDPSFESFVKIQLRFFNENYQRLNELQTKLDAQTKQDYVEGKLESKIDDVLNKMRMLDITGSTGF